MDTPAVYPRTLLAPLLTTDPDAWLALQLRTPPELLVRQRHLLARSRAAALPIDYVGIFSLFAGYRFYPGTHHDWVFINAADDPLLHNRDGFPLPRHIRQQLHQFTQAGLEFDALYLAHELPPGSLTADTSVSGDLLAPPPLQLCNGCHATAGRSAAGSGTWSVLRYSQPGYSWAPQHWEYWRPLLGWILSSLGR